MPKPPSRVLAAALADDEAALRAAIAAGDDIDEWDETGLTPLLSAVFIGYIGAVRLLLDAGADPNKGHRHDRDATPLWHARHDFGLHDIADLLEARGATSPQN